MMRFFKLLFSSLLFIAAACGDSNTDNPTPTPEPKPEKAPFTITVNNIKAIMAEVTVVPTDAQITYYTDVINDKDFQTAMKNGFDDYLNWLIDKLMRDENISFSKAVERITSKGKEDYTLTSLNPNSLYHAVAVGIDSEGHSTTEVVSKSFTTLDAKKSDNKLSVEISNLTINGGKISVKTTNRDSYVLNIIPTTIVEGMTNMEIAQKSIDDNIAWGGILEMIHEGDFSYNEQECKPNWEYYVVVFGYDEGVITTEPICEKFTTLEGGDPAACQFDITHSFSTFDLNINVKPSDNTVVYVCDVIEEEYYQEAVKLYGSEEGALDAHLNGLIDFYVQDLGNRGAVVDLITTCGEIDFLYRVKADTEYRIFAVAANQAGEAVAPYALTEKFLFEGETISDVTLTLNSYTLYNGDDLYELDPETFKGTKGYAVLATSVTPSEGAVEWYHYAIDIDLTKLSRRTLITELLNAPTQPNLTEQFIICRWGENWIWGVAKDEAGNYGEVMIEHASLNKADAADVPSNLLSTLSLD